MAAIHGNNFERTTEVETSRQSLYRMAFKLDSLKPTGGSVSGINNSARMDANGKFDIANNGKYIPTSGTLNLSPSTGNISMHGGFNLETVTGNVPAASTANEGSIIKYEGSITSGGRTTTGRYWLASNGTNWIILGNWDHENDY